MEGEGGYGGLFAFGGNEEVKAAMVDGDGGW